MNGLIVECIWNRGPLSDHGVTRRLTEQQLSGNLAEGHNVPIYYDMKICYSTISGFNAFRDPVEGSWYVQILCNVFANHSHDTHFDDLLKIIGELMNRKRNENNNQSQTTSNEDRGFNKNLFFNPGHYA